MDDENFYLYRDSHRWIAEIKEDWIFTDGFRSLGKIDRSASIEILNYMSWSCYICRISRDSGQNAKPSRQLNFVE